MANLFKPKLPTPEPPTPLPDQKQLTAARRRAIAKETAQGGGQTILSSGVGETLGP